MTKAYSYIRMSTDLQLKGDSRRRQLEASEAYARSNGLDLVADFKLEDIGVSAFKGANVATGRLGKFLEAIRAGKIEKGSYLLIESLDRLSRQAVMQSQTIFLEIVNAGINIVTLADNHLYKSGATDLADLIYSLVIMSRAHEESLTKSVRLSAAWQNKRNKISGQKLTARCPLWLSISPDRHSFEVDKDRVAIVERIFRDCASGIGSFSIAKRLNKLKVPAFGRSTGWQVSSVTTILQSRAVIGEYQPHKLVAGKRVPTGAPIADYYPAIVTEDTFNRAQQVRAQRRSGAGGRRGLKVSNLFSRIAKCGYCGASMHFVNKGANPKSGGAYLVCDSARRGLGCQKTGWPYPDFETSFLTFVREVDLASLVSGDKEARERSDLEKALQAIEGKLVELRARRERTYELIGGDTPSTFIRDKLADLQSLIEAAEVKSRERLAELEAKRSETGRVAESRERIKDLISALQSDTNTDTFELRSQIAVRLGAIVDTLKLLPAGLAPKKQQTIAMLQHLLAEPVDDQLPGLEMLLETFEDDTNTKRAHRRGFLVGLRQGTIRIVFPDSTDPTRLDEQLFGDLGSIVREDGEGRITKVLDAGDRRRRVRDVES